MTNPFNFTLSPKAKLVIIALSIFLISLSLGLLVFGTDGTPQDALSADVLKHSSEAVHITH
ncbi:hypothetical protein HN748_02785 [Candidatus Peregrinibacteria bacterium]|jgi:hypothetical protein|nr:hypothetical protein [Candidatus Peregrinibacteria bacterium]MBT7483286.1 hypothetical protein [Candidatus Peregrinibacteria bacterium]MBT7703133.1 hypothetical protein [Candidatus Peregrinibacteria bacterium]